MKRTETLLEVINTIADGLISGIAIGHDNFQKNAKETGKMLKRKVKDLKEELKIK